MKRNGVVSGGYRKLNSTWNTSLTSTVFLRILEYYPGILFLTTNRVGSIDDAFRSRLHLTLYYPKLDRKQTKQIWSMNLKRVADLNKKREAIGQPTIDIRHQQIVKFVKKNWETLSWNGRQIRNAFQTAVALAEFDVRNEAPGTRPVMSKGQFKTIAKASMQFDDYLFLTHGKSDEATNARREQNRWDYKVQRRAERPKVSPFPLPAPVLGSINYTAIKPIEAANMLYNKAIVRLGRLFYWGLRVFQVLRVPKCVGRQLG